MGIGGRLADHVRERRMRVPVYGDVDVAVAGAGIAGTFAAIASARLGAATILIDRFGQPGGNIGPGMIVGGGLFNEAPETLPGGIAGIAREFADRFGRLAPDGGPNYARDSQVASYLLCVMCREAGVELLLPAYAADPIVRRGRVRGLFVEVASGRVAVKAGVVVDATGEAAIAARAGAPVVSRVAADPSHQALIREPYRRPEFAWWCETGAIGVIAGVDLDEYRAASARDAAVTSADDEPLPGWADEVVAGFPRCLQPVLSRSWLRNEFRIIRELDDRVYVAASGGFGDCGDGNVSCYCYTYGQIDLRDARCVSRMEEAVRGHAFETTLFMKRHAPGFQRASLVFVSPYLGARGGPFIEGRHVLTVDEAFHGRTAPDVIYRNIHEGLHGGAPSGYDVSYGMLLPRNLRGMLVTGRGASYVRRGHDPSGMRARPSMMVLGNVTGIAAAMSARRGICPDELEVRELQREILRQGICIGGEERIRELNLA